jgi:4-carboxymuconolactone decarboxylase
MTEADDPRLPLLSFAEWDDAARATLLPFLRRPEVYLSGAPDAPPMPAVLELFAQHLPLSGSWLPFTEMLSGPEACLAPALRELAILRVAWRTGSGYEWRAHHRMGGDAGLSTAQLDAIADGPAAAVWSPLERALLRATDDMIDQHRVGDESWAELAAHFGPAELLELLFVVGGYLCLAAVLNSAGLEPEIADR